MTTNLLLWLGLAAIVALFAIAVWAGRRGMRSLGVINKPGPEGEDLKALTTELGRLNANLEALIAKEEKKEANDE